MSHIAVHNSASHVEDVNLYSSQQQRLGLLDCELEIIYFSFYPKLDELCLLNLQKKTKNNLLR